MASEIPKLGYIKPQYFNLTSNAPATKNSRVLNYIYKVKGFQCHCNHLPQLFDFNTKQQASLRNYCTGLNITLD